MLWILANCQSVTRDQLVELMFIVEDMTRRDTARAILQRVETSAQHYHIAGNEVYTASKVRTIIRDIGGLT
jgi:hypothetical protein